MISSLLSAVRTAREYHDHSLVLRLYDRTTKLRGYIAVHRGGVEQPAFGATRYHTYESEAEALEDALRLSRLMSYKSAMAGLPYGGAKAVLIKDTTIQASKAKQLEAYARKLNMLHGSFITGTDVGLSAQDLKTLLKTSKYLVGRGFSPEKPAAEGVFTAMQIALAYRLNHNSLKDVRVAIQGVGKTGAILLAQLYKEGAKVVFSDVDRKLVKTICKKYPKAKYIAPDKIHAAPVDVFAPCALSHSLSKQTISQIKASIVCGTANNQLAKPEDGNRLHKQNILYIPDYVANAGGLIGVVDEYEHGRHSARRMQKRIEVIAKNVEAILRQHKRTNKPTNLIADKMAEKLFNGNGK